MSLNNEFDPIGGDGVPASLDAVPQEASPRIIITAQTIQWEAHRSGQQWTEGRYGYCITLESEDLPETPYVATLGEGDPETFATLAEAQAWCQGDIDATVARWAVVAAPPPQSAPKAEAPAAPAERGLLCPSCNSAIGLLGEDPKRFAAAVAYLEKHRG